MISNLNAIVLNLGSATPAEEYSFKVGGNSHTESYVYSMLRIMGVVVKSIKDGEFTVVVPEEASFPSPNNETLFVKFLGAYAKEDSSLNPLLLRDQIWEFAVSNREYSDDEWVEWKKENDHEWEELDQNLAKPLKISEKVDEKKKAKSSKPMIPGYLKALAYLALAIVTAFYVQVNVGFGSANSSFYDQNFLAAMIKAPTTWIDTIGGLLASLLPIAIAEIVFMAFLGLVAIKGVKSFFGIFKKSEKSTMKLGQRLMYIVLVAIPTFIVKVWLWGNFVFFCVVFFNI
jgi:hypothetical protein